MLRFFGTILVLCLGLITGAQADSAVSCIQEQLTALGQDPGPVDGQFGRKTASAFAGLRAENPGRLEMIDAPEFSADNAGAWCSALGTSFAEASAIYERYGDALESGFTFDVAPEARPALVAEIKDGLDIARAYIAKTFGVEIPLEARRRMTVKIVATGKGNTEPAGGGGVATAFSAGHSVPRPFFDVAHEQWSQNTQGRGWTTHADNMKSVVHEYTHGWQMMLGAIDINNQPLGNWMNEGLAEYVAYSAMADAGLIKWRDAQIFMTRAATGVETDYPLKTFGSTRTPAWAGHVGFVALDWLISDTETGIVAIRTLAEEVAAGRSQRQAFANTFGLELEDFYEQFDAWAKAIRKNPDRALARRPELVLAGRATPQTAADDPLAAEKCVQAALNANGYPVGGVDGQVGNGTRAAFEKYKRGLDMMAQSMPFRDGTYAMWCLFMTGSSPLAGDLAALQAQVEAGAKVVLGFKTQEGASFRVVMRRGETDLASLDSPVWDKAAGEYLAEFDYGAVKQADNVCAVFSDGWLVKDRAGKTYEASCDRVIPAVTTSGRVVWSYDLLPPASTPAPAAISAPASVTNVVVSQPPFPDLRTEADHLIDAMENKSMKRPGDSNIAPEDLAQLLVGKTVVVRYLPGKSVAEIHFGQDGSFRFLFDGEPRGGASTFTVHPRGWVCLHRNGGGQAACEKYVRNGGDVFRLNPVDGRLKAEIMGDRLATRGDPNPGLKLIPSGWNGIYRSAEMTGGQWQAQRYSGEVDTYRTCKLLDDTYIICQ